MAEFSLMKGLKILGRGLMTTAAPEIAKGFIINEFHKNKIDVDKIIVLVQNNTSLWDSMTEEGRIKANSAILELGDVSWFTPEWLINNLRKDLPAQCSLFLSWPEAYSWLVNQVNELKTGLKIS